jgi:hypothetical protein
MKSNPHVVFLLLNTASVMWINFPTNPQLSPLLLQGLEISRITYDSFYVY